MRGRPLLPLLSLTGLALLIVAQGCVGKGPLPSCPGEEAGTLAGGNLPEVPPQAVSDPTAGGVLHGRSTRRDGPHKMILLLDYSGSMYGGYGKPQVAGCARCAAGLVDGRPSRSTQPYYVATPSSRSFSPAGSMPRPPPPGISGSRSSSSTARSSVSARAVWSPSRRRRSCASRGGSRRRAPRKSPPGCAISRAIPTRWTPRRPTPPTAVPPWKLLSRRSRTTRRSSG